MRPVFCHLSRLTCGHLSTYSEVQRPLCLQCLQYKTIPSNVLWSTYTYSTFIIPYSSLLFKFSEGLRCIVSFVKRQDWDCWCFREKWTEVRWEQTHAHQHTRTVQAMPTKHYTKCARERHSTSQHTCFCHSSHFGLRSFIIAAFWIMMLNVSRLASRASEVSFMTLWDLWDLWDLWGDPKGYVDAWIQPADADSNQGAELKLRESSLHVAARQEKPWKSGHVFIQQLSDSGKAEAGTHRPFKISWFSCHTVTHTNRPFIQLYQLHFPLTFRAWTFWKVSNHRNIVTDFC